MSHGAALGTRVQPLLPQRAARALRLLVRRWQLLLLFLLRQQRRESTPGSRGLAMRQESRSDGMLAVAAPLPPLPTSAGCRAPRAWGVAPVGRWLLLHSAIATCHYRRVVACRPLPVAVVVTTVMSAAATAVARAPACCRVPPAAACCRLCRLLPPAVGRDPACLLLPVEQDRSGSCLVLHSFRKTAGPKGRRHVLQPSCLQLPAGIKRETPCPCRRRRRSRRTCPCHHPLPLPCRHSPSCPLPCDISTSSQHSFLPLHAAH